MESENEDNLRQLEEDLQLEFIKLVKEGFPRAILFYINLTVIKKFIFLART